MPYIKNKIRVNVPKRSGFDKSHRNSGTGYCGTLIPLLCDEVIPNTRVSLRINLATQLPPLVSDTYMNVKQKVEAFFVPGRLLCKSYEPWFCDRQDRVFSSGSTSTSQSGGAFRFATPAVPVLGLSNAVSPNFASAGSLADYLGFTGTTPTAGISISLLPFIAYHLIWQEYYRNPQVQNPAFCPSLADTADLVPTTVIRVANILEQYFTYSTDIPTSGNYIFTLTGTNAADFQCADGVSLFDLRQRNFGLDYFTGARPSAQMGSAAAVSLAIPAGTDAAGGTTSFTIQQLRAANSLQQFRERNNLPGTRLVEQVKARYGANLSDGVAQRPICIGSATYDYGSRGVSQTGAWTGSPNIFNGIAAEYGRAYSAGSDFLIEDFIANEPGYIMVLTSMVPEVSYTFGIDPLFTRYTSPGCIVNMANPLLQNVGDQPIMSSELSPASINQVFGYQDRYADFMFKRNSVHGAFNGTSGSLKQFVLQRQITGNPVLGTSFLEIPKTYLDGVVQVSSTASDCSYWYDCMLDYKVSMPLAEFSIPSLQDPAYEHGQSVSLHRNGQIF